MKLSRREFFKGLLSTIGLAVVGVRARAQQEHEVYLPVVHKSASAEVTYLSMVGGRLTTVRAPAGMAHRRVQVVPMHFVEVLSEGEPQFRCVEG